MTDRRLFVLLPALLAWLLLARPYEGLRHDGVLYFGQALLHSRVPELARDVFFAGGSQDSYSVYSPLIAALYRVAGVGTAHLGLLLACWAATFVALLLWLRQLGVASTLLSLLGLLAVAVAAPFYGGLHIFGLLEPFVTARTLAEPLVVASLICLARDRLLAGLALQLVAASFHPLMALPAVAITWVLAAWRDRRWLWLLLAIPVLLALAATGLAPASLLQRYDDAWWQLVSRANMQVVPANWSGADWLTGATDALVVGMAARLMPSLPCRRLLAALLGSTASLLLLGVIGTDGLHAVLITQIQPWRALWLLHLATLALAPFVTWTLWQRGGPWPLSAALLVLALVGSHAASLYGFAILPCWAIATVAASRGWPVSQGLRLLGMGGCAVGIVLLSVSHGAALFERLRWLSTDAEGPVRFAHLLTEPMIAFPAAIGLALLARHSRAGHAAALALGLVGLGFALLHWDHRDDITRTVEASATEHPFKRLIPADAAVYWPEQLAATWGLLERSSHYNRQQNAGILFSHETADLIAPRREAYQPLMEARDGCRLSVWLSHGTPQALAACDRPTAPQLRKLCTGPVHPDYLVLENALAPPPLATWALGDTLYRLYACTQFAGAPP